MKLFVKGLLCAGLALGMVACATSPAMETKLEEVQEEEDLSGNYQDSVSQRATMDVTKNEDGTYHIFVSWSSSAFEGMTWEMNAEKVGDTLTYQDCVTKMNDEVQEEIQKGSFDIKDGKLEWTGSHDPSCQNCVFEKVQLG